VRRSSVPSELARLAAPLGRVFDAAWRRMHWWILAMALFYAVSGITVIRPDEVAVVERWGRLVGDTAATRQHGPGLLFAFPRPVDQVVRVKTKYVQQLPVRTLDAPVRWAASGNTLDPLRVGYALTGDQNVVHVGMIARYRVRDPVEWAFYGPRAEDVLRTEVSAAMVRSLGEVSVDRVLAEERKDVIRIVTQRAQVGLDAAHSGLELVTLELTELVPPQALAASFEAVQSAFIEAETKKKAAQAYAEEVRPRARAEADQAVQVARADTATSLARAAGDTAAFLDLQHQYALDPLVVRERLYRDAVDKAIGGAAAVRWVPPPAGAHYEGFRVLVSPEEAGVATTTPGPPAAEPPAAPDAKGARRGQRVPRKEGE
jgi:membrane protease subunit HflK